MMSHSSIIQKDSLTTWLVEWLSDRFKLEKQQIDPGQSFLRYGMDSVTAAMLISDLEDLLKCSLSPTLTWDYPSVYSLSQYLSKIGTTEID